MTARIALASLFVVAAVLAKPWQSDLQRWVLGVSVVAVVMLFAWWGGLFLTTRVARRLGIWRRNHLKHNVVVDPYRETVVLRVDPADAAQLPTVVSYLDRYGIKCDKVRVTHRDANGTRRSWISLTVAATDNLAALQARSSRIPLRDTVEVVGRRLADQLREEGWNVTMVDGVDTPEPEAAKETWRGMADEGGFVAAYRMTVGDGLSEALAELSAPEVWTVFEFTGSPTAPRLAVAAVLRSEARPDAKSPVRGMTPVRGRHQPTLQALNPTSTERLDWATVAAPKSLLSVEHEPAEEAGHPA